MWIGAGVGAFALMSVLGTAGLGSYQWFQGAGKSHVKTEANTEAIDKIADVLEGIQDLLCRDEIRRCVEKAQKEGTDPIECLDIKCAQGQD